MKNIAAFLILAMLWSVPALSDEITLNDGRRVTWKSLVDQGDEYAVEMPDGTKLRIKKSDIDRVVVGAAAPAGPPLTGASFTINKKKAVTVDLMPKADPSGAGVSGTWKKRGSVLTGSASGFVHAKIPIDYSPVPEEYDLTIVAERKESINGLYFGLLGAGNKLFVMHLDSVEGTVCGVDVSEKDIPEGEENPRTVGPAFKNNISRLIKLMVRKDAFIVQLDGHDFIAWKADYARASHNAALTIPQKDRLYMGIYGSTWKISSITLTFSK